MERLEVVLKKASNEETKEAIDNFLTSRALDAQNHELHIGRPFNGNPNRNYFWLNPATKAFAVDYGNNLMHIVRGQLATISVYLERQNSKISYSSAEDKQAHEQLVQESIEALRHYLTENVVMYLIRKIDINDSTLGVSNRKIFNDIILLNAKTGSAFREMKKYGVRSQHFLFRAGELVEYYNKVVKDFYDEANNELRLKMVH